MGCPDESALAGYATGTASAEAHAQVDAHVDQCAQCRAVVVALLRAPGLAGTRGPLAGGSGDDTLPVDAAALAAPVTDVGPFGPVGADRFDLGAEIGRGGMGRVVRARDRRLEREVAIKELLGASPDQERRFEREAKVTARLQHPAIVAVHEAGRWHDGRPFYAMKLVTGKPLATVLADTHTFAERLALLPSVLAVADALAYAHSERVIHRDLKPGNVLVGAFGETVVIDWGLAKDLAARAAATGQQDERMNPPPGVAGDRTSPSPSSSGTVAGAVLGTPSYMAPEQAAGRAVDERADVYALGALLYEVLAGKPPYAGPTAGAIVAAVRAGPPRGIQELEPRVPPELSAIVAKAMARDPADRYPTARELADDLRRFQTGQLVGSHRYTRLQLARRFVARHRTALAAFAAALAVGAVTVGRIVAESRRARRAEVLAEASEDQVKKEAAALRNERDEAQRGYLASLKGLAVQALIAGQAMRAAAYLVPVYQAHPDDPGVRFLVARAVATIDPLERTLVLARRAQATEVDVRYVGDGRRVVAGGLGDSATLWNADTGALLRTFGQGAAVTTLGTLGTGSIPAASAKVARAVACSADGRVLATAEGSVARLWDVRSGESLGSVDGHGGDVYAVALSPDGSLLATGSQDGGLRIWQASSLRPLRAVAAGASAVYTVAFSPDGARIAAGSADQTARLFTSAGALLRTLPGAGQTLAWSPDGARLAAANTSGTSAGLFDARTGARLATLEGHQGAVLGIAYCPNGRWIATASEDRTARLWDAGSGEPLAVLEGHADEVTSIECSSDSTRLLTGSSDGTARIWRIPDAARLPILGPAASQASFGAGGRLVAVVTGKDSQIWSVASGALVRTLAGPADDGGAVTLRADGRVVATAQSDHGIEIRDVATGALLQTLRGHTDTVWQMAFSPDGTRLASASADGTARIWDLATGRSIAILQGLNQMYAVAYRPDGRDIATGDGDGVAFWNADDGTLRRRGEKAGGGVLALAYTPDGTRLITGGTDGIARIRDAQGGQVLASLEGHAGSVDDVGFNADGTLAVTAGDDTARIWDARTGELLDSFAVGGGYAVWAAFDPDGRTGITTSDTGRAKLWDWSLETRSPAAIAALVEARVPLVLAGGRLVPVGRRVGR